MTQHELQVTRTARYVTLDPPTGEVDRVWIALHGHATLAGRFAEHLAPMADGRSLVVVPEALSRFYLQTGLDGMHRSDAVGATWLTREAREADIADTVGYLDRLAQTVTAPLRKPAPLGILGFSQGAATAARWVAQGAVRAERLILWGHPLPHDVAPSVLARRMAGGRIILVAGDADPLVPVATVTKRAGELEGHGAEVVIDQFSGGHEMPVAVLLRVTAGL